MRRLDELSFADLTPLGQCLKTHLGKDRYIHFTKLKGKLGVNVKTHHGDPPGVYFYPVDWLWQHESFHEGQQFATNWPHYYIAEIDFTRPGLDLSTITEAQIEELGRKNGWLKDYEEFSPMFQMRNGPAQKMWELLKSMNARAHNLNKGLIERNSTGAMSWLKSLRGMGWIKDMQGIIMAHEFEQACVIDPRCMRIIDSDQQPEINIHDWDKWTYWRHPFVGILKTLQQRHGGTIVWRNKKPTWSIGETNWTFAVSWNDSYSSAGIRIVTRTGRATDSNTLLARKLKEREIDEIVGDIEERLAVCQTFDGNDLDFTPAIPPERVLEIIDEHVRDRHQVKPEWEIMKGMNFMRADIRTRYGRPPADFHFGVGVSDKEVFLQCTIKINDRYVASVGKSIANFEEKFMHSLDEYCPGKPDGTYKTFEEDQWEPFLGWLYYNTGLKVLEKYEEKFTRYTNIKELYGQIDFVFSRVGW